MNILTITNLYPPASIGGYEQACRDVTEGLRGRGHDVRVVTSDWRRFDVRDDEADVVRALRLRTSWADPAFRKHGLGAAFESARIQSWNVKTLREEIARFSPDVVVIWNGLHLGAASLIEAEKMPTVYYLSDLWVEGLASAHASQCGARRLVRSAVQQWLTGSAAALRLADGVYCSRALRDQYAEGGVRFARETVIYHGIDPAHFPERDPHIAGRGSQPERILYVGQLVPEKGVLTLIRGLALLRQSVGHEQARLTIAGSVRNPAFAASLESEIESHHLRDAITIGPKPRSELPDIYGSHDVLAFTSEWAEPFSLTLLEAMASAIPVVSTLRGGSAEIVRDGENALVFEAGDPADLAAKLGTMLSDPGRASKMATRAARTVRTSFTLERQVSQVEQHLLDVTSRSAYEPDVGFTATHE